MQTVVITGASGFIGSHCTIKLRLNGFNVIPVTRKKFQGMITVNDYKDVPNGDILIHLGEDSDRGHVNSLGVDYFKVATSSVNTLAQKFEGRMIYGSSAVVYGDQGAQPFKTDSKTYSVDTYSSTKIANESTVSSFGGISFRFSNVYGEGMSEKNILSDIIKQLNTDGPIVVRNESPIRDYIHISSITDLIINSIKNYQDGVFNVGSGVGTSIHQLARLILGVAAQKNRQIHSLMKSEENSYSVLNTSKTQKAFNWIPQSDMKPLLPSLIGKNIDKIK